jgi:hypothetical protein
MLPAVAKANTKAPKLNPSTLKEAVGALAIEDELARLTALRARLDPSDVEVAQALLEMPECSERGVASAWLRSLVGVELTDQDARAIGELSSVATMQRQILATLGQHVADRIEPALLARATAQLDPAVPFAPIVLGAGRAAVRAHGDAALADRLDARAEFAERHAQLLADLQADAKEKEREAATKALDGLRGDERMHAAVWLLSYDGAARDAKTWATRVGISDSRIDPLLVALAISSDKDDSFAPLLVASPERAVSFLEVAVERGWGALIDHVARLAPKTFATPGGFATVLRGFETAKGDVLYNLLENVRHWVPPLDGEQAVQIAKLVIDLLEHPSATTEHLDASVGGAFFYFEHPASLATFVEVFERDPSDLLREELYNAIENIETKEAQDALIDRLFVETRKLRTLVYAFNKAVPKTRHGEVLARLDAQPSFDVAWLYTGCQVSWAHSPRGVIDVVERVLAWPAEGDPQRRAFVMSAGVRAALALRRFELARTCLAALDKAKTAADPTEADPVDTVLADDALTEQLAKLKSKKLDAEDRALAEEIVKARAAGKPRLADDARLGALAATEVAVCLHRDAATHEAWFLDREGAFFYYDGYGIAPPPFKLDVLALVHGWDHEIPGLAKFCAAWITEGRALHKATSDFRLVMISDRRVLVRYSGVVDQTAQRVFAFTFPDAAAATRAFAALRSNDPDGYKAVDPYYVAGKRGGTWVYQYGNRTEYGFVVGHEMGWGDSKWAAARSLMPSHAEAVASFEVLEAGALKRGQAPRTIELEDQIRPLDDMPLAQWLHDRARDDERDAAWHLHALPDIHTAMLVTGLPLDDIDASLGQPASAAELAAYDATLPEPMPAAMRAMWSAARTAQWRVGDDSMRILAPDEVVAKRNVNRAELAKRIGQLRGGSKVGWELEFLDVFALRGDEPHFVYDVRQTELDTWYRVSGKSLGSKSGQSLSWSLGAEFACDFVAALTAQHKEIKTLKYGQSIHDKPKAKAKPKKKR